MSSVSLSSYFNPDYGTFHNLGEDTSSDQLESLKVNNGNTVLFTPWSIYDAVFTERRRLNLTVLDHYFESIPIATILTFRLDAEDLDLLEANKSAFTGEVFKYAGAYRMLGTFENIMMLAIMLPQAVVHNSLFIPKSRIDAITQHIPCFDRNRLLDNGDSVTNNTVKTINISLVDRVTASYACVGK